MNLYKLASKLKPDAIFLLTRPEHCLIEPSQPFIDSITVDSSKLISSKANRKRAIGGLRKAHIIPKLSSPTIPEKSFSLRERIPTKTLAAL